MIKAYAEATTFKVGGVTYHTNNFGGPTSKQGLFYAEEAAKNAGTSRGNTDLGRTKKDIANESYRTAKFVAQKRKVPKSK